MNMIKVAVGGVLIFAGMKKLVKNQTANTALIALGAVTLVNQVPTVNQYIL